VTLDVDGGLVVEAVVANVGGELVDVDEGLDAIAVVVVVDWDFAVLDVDGELFDADEDFVVVIVVDIDGGFVVVVVVLDFDGGLVVLDVVAVADGGLEVVADVDGKVVIWVVEEVVVVAMIARLNFRAAAGQV